MHWHGHPPIMTPNADVERRPAAKFDEMLPLRYRRDPCSNSALARIGALSCGTVSLDYFAGAKE
jgi:hypothetical protein